MKIETVELYKYFNIETNKTAKLTIYVPNETAKGVEKPRLRPSVLIIPGGGYTHVGRREGEPVAMRFLTEGFIPFLLEYSTDGEGYPCQQIEASLAMALIRGSGKDYNADSNKVAVIGFSAGAHLACSLSCIYDEKEAVDKLKYIEYFKKNGFEKIKADALILCYPVISSDKNIWHKGSFMTLTNGNNELMDRLSLEKRIKKGFPPTYIWHTATDETVPVYNSYLLALSLQKNGVPYQLHIHENGEHGLSLADKTVKLNEKQPSKSVFGWFDEMIVFLKEHEISF